MAADRLPDVLLKLLAYLLLAIAAGSASSAARRSRELLPVAAFLAFVLLSSGVRAALHGTALPLERALVVSEPLAMAGAAAVVFSGPPAWLALVGAAVALVGAGAASSAEELRLVYLAAELGGLFLAVGAVGTWAVRGRRPGPAQAALALVVAIEALVVVAGPWRWDLWGGWALAQVAYCVLYASLAALMLGWRAAG